MSIDETAASALAAAHAAAPPVAADGDTLTVWPEAPRAERRVLRRLAGGEIDGGRELDATPLDRIASERWQAWNRSLREALGEAAGAPPDEANAAGRAVVREAQRDGRADFAAVKAGVEAFFDRDALALLRRTGIVSPALADYNRAVRHRETLERLVTPPAGAKPPAEGMEAASPTRNVAALGFAVAGDEQWERVGDLTDAVRAFVGIERWDKSEAKRVWARFRRLAPSTAAAADAGHVMALALAPERPADVQIIERLTTGVLNAAARFAEQHVREDAGEENAGEDDGEDAEGVRRSRRLARELVGWIVDHAARAGTDHELLLWQFAAAKNYLAVRGWPDGDFGSWGGFWRRIEREAIEARDAMLAEAQAMAAEQDGRRWERLLAPYDDGGFTVLELTTSVALAEEGAVMHHCVGQEGMGYAAACERGERRIFSIRRGADGRRIGTAAVNVRGDGHSLKEISGFKNATPTEALRAVAGRIAERCDDATARGRRNGGQEE